jgi:long-chain acyl-CoA synthetase
MAAIAVNAAEWSELSPEDRNLTVLSLALPAARVLDVYAPLSAGSQITVAEAPATIQTDLREVSPSVLTLSPRAAELLRQSSVRRSRESARLRRAAYDWAMRKLDERLDKRDGARTLAGARRGRGLPYLLVGRWVAADLGLQRTRRIVVAGGALPARVARFFWSLGIPVLETYGQAELGGVALAQSSLDDAGTVGRPLPGVHARIMESGELAVTTPAAGSGGEEVWHETGDIAEDAGDGRVRVRGRRDDVVRTPHGDVVVDELETALCESAYIRRAVVTVVGDGGLTALVEVDFDETAPWAAAQDIYFSTYGSLVSRPEVSELIAGEVAAANDRLESSGEVADFVVFPRELTVRDGELTSSLVVRRSVVVENFAAAATAERTSAAPRVGVPSSS